MESDSGKSTLKFDSGIFPVRPNEAGVECANVMFDIYNKVGVVGLPILFGDRFH